MISYSAGVSALVTASESLIPVNQWPFAITAGLTVLILGIATAVMDGQHRKQARRK